MKVFIVLAAVIALAVAAPADSDTVVLRESSDVDPSGYKFEYAQSDGVSRSEEGAIKNAGTEQESYEVRGSVTWTAPDGEVYTLNFVADENGYRPEGAHIPQA